MFTQRNIAGLLTCFGIAGLAMSPFILSPVAAATKTSKPAFAVAISSGPQLILSSAVHAKPGKSIRQGNRREMVCARVYRLSIADIGLNCTSSLHPQTVATATR